MTPPRRGVTLFASYLGLILKVRVFLQIERSFYFKLYFIRLSFQLNNLLNNNH